MRPECKNSSPRRQARWPGRRNSARRQVFSLVMWLGTARCTRPGRTQTEPTRPWRKEGRVPHGHQSVFSRSETTSFSPTAVGCTGAVTADTEKAYGLGVPPGCPASLLASSRTALLLAGRDPLCRFTVQGNGWAKAERAPTAWRGAAGVPPARSPGDCTVAGDCAAHGAPGLPPGYTQL